MKIFVRCCKVKDLKREIKKHQLLIQFLLQEYQENETSTMPMLTVGNRQKGGVKHVS